MRNLATHVWITLDKLKERTAYARLRADGSTEEVTYAEWMRRVQRFAVGFMERGLEPGQRVALVGASQMEAVAVAIAAWIAGGCVVWVAPGEDRVDVLRRLGRSGADWVVVGDPASLERVRGDGAKMPPTLRWLVLEGSLGRAAEGVFELAEFEEFGRKRAVRGGVDRLQKQAFGVKPDQPSLIVFDPEGGDDPHGAYFTGEKVARMLGALGEDLQLGEDERLACLLGYAWFHAWWFAVAGLMRGATLCDAPSVGELASGLGALAPTRVIAGPAFLERQAGRWREHVERTPELLREVGSSPLASALGALSERAVRAFHKPVREDVGERLRQIYVVGGRLPAEAFDVLEQLGIAALGLWGLPECGVSHMERPGATRRDSVGRPVQGYACKIQKAKEGATGEILIKSAELFDGYWDERGPRSIGEDGWLRTGVTGVVREGFLYVGGGDG